MKQRKKQKYNNSNMFRLFSDNSYKTITWIDAYVTLQFMLPLVFDEINILAYKYDKLLLAWLYEQKRMHCGCLRKKNYLRKVYPRILDVKSCRSKLQAARRTPLGVAEFPGVNK